jgi:hypothetical protein
MNNTLPIHLTVPVEIPARPSTIKMILAWLSRAGAAIFHPADDPAARCYAAAKYNGSID